jgi:hypothetical protein
MNPSFVTNVSPSLGIQFAVEAVFYAPRYGNKLMTKKAIAQASPTDMKFEVADCHPGI